MTDTSKATGQTNLTNKADFGLTGRSKKLVRWPLQLQSQWTAHLIGARPHSDINIGESNIQRTSFLRTASNVETRLVSRPVTTRVDFQKQFLIPMPESLQEEALSFDDGCRRNSRCPWSLPAKMSKNGRQDSRHTACLLPTFQRHRFLQCYEAVFDSSKDSVPILTIAF